MNAIAAESAEVNMRKNVTLSPEAVAKGLAVAAVRTRRNFSLMLEQLIMAEHARLITAATETPEAQGRRARREGAAITSNPYDEERQPEDWGDWHQGYMSEDYELELAKEGAQA